MELRSFVRKTTFNSKHKFRMPGKFDNFDEFDVFYFGKISVPELKILKKKVQLSGGKILSMGTIDY